jgi:phosphoglycerate dehydrogenase-like enzyme
MSIHVLVTEPEYRRAESLFRTAEGFTCEPVPSDEPGLAAAIRRTGVRAVIVGHQKYEGPLYEALPAGGLIARFGVGHDGVDKQRATERGLLCTNAPGVLDTSVAEFTMLMLGAASRFLGAMDADMRAGVWQPRTGVELVGKTLTIIGIGRIGRAVARIASRGFGMRVIGCARPGRTIGSIPDVDVVTTDYYEAVRDADFVVLLIPNSPETRHYMSAERLAAIPPRAWLINTARGAVVDEAALYEALAGGRLAGAAIDVYDQEPYVPVDPGHDLRTLPNVLLTPHVGSATPEANRAMGRRALQNVALLYDGRYEAMDILNPAVLERLAK